MKKLYPLHMVKTSILATALLLSSVGWAQPGKDLFQGYGYAGLRHVDINEMTTTDFLCDSSYFYLNTDSISDDWVLDERAVYGYDNQGREAIRDISTYNEERWIKKQQIRSTYISDFLNTRQEFAWDDAATKWTPHTKHNYDYNNIGLINEINTLKFIDSKWISDKKIKYTYNTEYLIEIESYFLWNEELTEWNPESRSLYVYNEDQDVSNEVFQVWVDSIGDWMNKTSEVFNFDNEDNLVSSTTRVWDKFLGAWINNSVVSIEYNSQGQPLRSGDEILDSDNNARPNQSDMIDYDTSGNVNERITSYWDDDLGSWDVYQKQINFWSKYIRGNLHTAEKEIRCVFSNPYTIGLPWYCESLKPDVVYTLRVYDLLGRAFYSDQFLGSSSFRINKHLEPGYYIFEISGGLDKHYEKVYVKS